MDENRISADMPGEELRSALNAECGKLEWKELEKHFARGVVIKVRAEIDLIEVAVAMVKDDKDKIEACMSKGEIVNASTQDARDWNDSNAMFWAIVVAPWVLVQEVKEAS